MTIRTKRLLALADRCDRKEASRILDGEIHCAVYHLVDLIGFSTEEVCRIYSSGAVVVRDCNGVLVDSFLSPAYTFDVEAARTLFANQPDADIYPYDATVRCAFALRALAAEDLKRHEETPASPRDVGFLSAVADGAAAAEKHK
jgi:hypothetical protein